MVRRRDRARIPAARTSRRSVWTARSFSSRCSRSNGYDFTISASDTDPFATSAAPSGGARNLYLWLTCADRGLSAFEADVAGSLTPLAFVPGRTGLNVYGADRLHARGGRMSVRDRSESSPRALDRARTTGGDLRLVPSASSGAITAVDCEWWIRKPWLDPRVFCFSSAGAPAIVGTNGCVESGARRRSRICVPTRGLSKVVLTGKRSAATPMDSTSSARAGEGAFVRLTREELRAEPPSRYEDAAVEEEHSYEYRVIVVQDGEERAFGPVSITTGNWPRFETRIEPVGPNPAVVARRSHSPWRSPCTRSSRSTT